MVCRCRDRISKHGVGRQECFVGAFAGVRCIQSEPVQQEIKRGSGVLLTICTVYSTCRETLGD